MLSSLAMGSLIVTFGIVCAATILTLSVHKPIKHKKALGWLAFANVSIIIWTLFHLFLDLNLFPAQFVDGAHYLAAHFFIVVASIGIYCAARELSR